MFVEQFPEMAAQGTGHDLVYAEWFAGMMATADTGGLPAYFAVFEFDLSYVSVPPPLYDIY